MKIDNAGCPHGCNSLGKILIRGKWEPCPIHGKRQESNILGGEVVFSNGVNALDVLHIPMEYRNRIGVDYLDTARLFLNEDIQKNCLKESVSQLQYMLETLRNLIATEFDRDGVNDELKAPNLYMHSLYFYANPILADLKPFLYSLLCVCFEKNLGVLPVISINDLAGLIEFQDYSQFGVYDVEDVAFISKQNRLAGLGADFYLKTGLTLTDYLKCSFCFVLDTNMTTKGGLRSFKGFLEERANRGLPTYVFSTAYFDRERENLLYDKSNTRNLSCVVPYLLLGKGSELEAREKGWLRHKNIVENGTPEGMSKQVVNGFTAYDFSSKNGGNVFGLDDDF